MLINLFLEISAKYIIRAITKEIMAIEKFVRRNVWKKFGINDLIKPPTKIIGIVPIKIDLYNFLYVKIFKIVLEVKLLELKRSLRKYQNIAKTLPSWIIAEIVEPGSSSPKRTDTTLRWAVLLIGTNSVNPWIKPYKKNSKYSKNLKIKVVHILIAKIITIYIFKVKAKMFIWIINFF